jgi:hypothetical protein
VVPVVVDQVCHQRPPHWKPVLLVRRVKVVLVDQVFRELGFPVVVVVPVPWVVMVSLEPVVRVVPVAHPTWLEPLLPSPVVVVVEATTTLLKAVPAVLVAVELVVSSELQEPQTPVVVEVVVRLHRDLTLLVVSVEPVL